VKPLAHGRMMETLVISSSCVNVTCHTESKNLYC